MEKEISQAVIRRMPRYYRYLGELLEEGVERISSNDLSNRMQVTASQIRQDLNNFGGFGQQGYGYNVQFYTNIVNRTFLVKICQCNMSCALVYINWFYGCWNLLDKCKM